MEQLIRKILLKLFPELEQRLHLLQFAVIVALPDAVQNGQLSTEFEARYAVNIRMLNADNQPHGPVFEDVPLPVHHAGHTRGQFAFPAVGSVVAVQYAYGDPERPVISSIYPFNLHLPALDSKETLLQHSSATYIRSTQSENWDLRARNKVRIGNQDVDLIEAVQRLARIAEGHTHPGVGTPAQAADFGKVKTDVGKIKVS